MQLHITLPLIRNVHNSSYPGGKTRFSTFLFVIFELCGNWTNQCGQFVVMVFKMQLNNSIQLQCKAAEAWRIKHVNIMSQAPRLHWRLRGFGSTELVFITYLVLFFKFWIRMHEKAAGAAFRCQPLCTVHADTDWIGNVTPGKPFPRQLLSAGREVKSENNEGYTANKATLG